MDFLTAFGLAMAGLCKAVAWRGGEERANRATITPVIVALWKRLRRATTRFENLVARYRAGALQPPRPRAPRKPLYGPPAPRPPGIMPNGRGWVLRLCPFTPGGMGAAPFRGYLENMLLNDKEMAEFLRAVPQAGRLLRPLCHMLAIPLTPELAPPPRASPPRASPPRAKPVPRPRPPRLRPPRIKTPQAPAAPVARVEQPCRPYPGFYWDP